MDDAYKVDAVQCTHPRRTRGSSSNTREGIKSTKGRFRKVGRSIRANVHISSPARVFSFLRLLHPLYGVLCVSSPTFSIAASLFHLFFSIPLFTSPVYSASVSAVMPSLVGPIEHR